MGTMFSKMLEFPSPHRMQMTEKANSILGITAYWSKHMISVCFKLCYMLKTESTLFSLLFTILSIFSICLSVACIKHHTQHLRQFQSTPDHWPIIGHACAHQLFQWLEWQSTSISGRVNQILGTEVSTRPPWRRTETLKCGRGDSEGPPYLDLPNSYLSTIPKMLPLSSEVDK